MLLQLLCLHCPGLEYNASSNRIVGVPQSGGVFRITITASNPVSSISQSHEFRIFDPLAFSTQLELSINPSSLGENPSNLAGLSMHLDASALPDQNGSILSVWSDSSGNERGLDRVRGLPKVVLNPELEIRKGIIRWSFPNVFFL